VIFIDRSIPRGVARALQAVRDDVLWLEDRFPHDAPDADWLREAGAQGWLVFSRDKRIRSRPAERQAIVAHRVGCFFLTQKQPLTRWEYLKLLVLALDEMGSRFASTPRPFMYGLRRSGQLIRIA
jgi:hypothetical protein